jgi:asparagine synthetase B (glutamine-hydrolysing)
MLSGLDAAISPHHGDTLLGRARVAFFGRVAIPGSWTLADLTRHLDGNEGKMEQLEGEFAAAYLAPDLRTISLYSTAVSRTPIYYCHTSRCLSWSTDPDQALGRPAQITDVDWDIIPSIILDGRLPADRTALHTVRRVPPGFRLDWSDGRYDLTRVDDIKIKNRQIPIERAAEEFRERLVSSIDRVTTTADSTIILLSGGIDSAAVAFEAGRQPSAALTLTTESIPQLHTNYRHATAVASISNTPHIQIDTSLLLSDVERYVQHLASRDVLSLRNINRAEFELAASATCTPGTSTVFLTGIFAEALFHFEPWMLRRASGLRRLNPLEGTRWMAGGASQQRVGPTPPPMHWTDNQFGRWMSMQALANAYEVDRVEARRHEHGDLPPRQEAFRRIVTSILVDDELAHENFAVFDRFQARRHDPFADRELIEFCGALPLESRAQAVDGRIVDKFLLRYAYLTVFGCPVAWSPAQVSESLAHSLMVARNATKMAISLNEESMLYRHDIIDSRSIVSMMSSPMDPTVRPHHPYLLRAFAAETWLRRLQRGETNQFGFSAHNKPVVKTL